jgi:hypothetical protein
MRIKITLLIITIALAANVSGQIIKRACFLGNSYTAVNNLPLLTASVAASVGDSLIYDSNTPGGYTLQQHSTNATSLSKIMVGTWDYVVLQEQSQLPSFPISQVQTDVFPYAHNLDSIINLYNPCAETMFYMTWGRKAGDTSNCASWPPVCTYSGMDSLLHLRYMMMADSNNAVVSPVGAVWKYIRQNYPTIELYQSDYSHPSMAGSYAAACTFYTCMYRKSPLPVTYTAGLAAADAANIRAAVKLIVFDSLMNWNIGKYDPVAGFTPSAMGGNTVSFGNTSLNATTYYWNFGDGDTSTSVNPVHPYATSSTFPVMLIATHCSYSDTITLSVNTTVAGVNTALMNNYSIYPNPLTDDLTIDCGAKKTGSIKLFNMLGEEIICKQITDNNRTTLHLNGIKKGVYILEIIGSDKTIMKSKIIKE